MLLEEYSGVPQDLEGVLNIEGPFLFKLIDALIISMGDVYSEISDKQKHIEKVVRAEEESFGKTLDRGLNLINKILTSTEGKVIPGKQEFLHYMIPMVSRQI